MNTYYNAFYMQSIAYESGSYGMWSMQIEF
jgi:hypothetical protein